MRVCGKCGIELTANNTYAQRLRDKQNICKLCDHKRRADVNKRIRQNVINHYGGSCACCGESRYEFLAIDHINGGGKQHIKSIGDNRLAKWIKRNNYPEGFRILCHNCNMSYGLYGFCPHNNTDGCQSGLLEQS